jgi:dienelactone hydrolase
VVSSHQVMVDEPVGISVVGLQPGVSVQLRLTLVTGPYTWMSQATFSANRSGEVDPARQAPTAGSYSGRDAMGLFWSAQPASTVPGTDAPHPRWTDSVHLSAVVDGREVAATDLLRFYLTPHGRWRSVRDRGLVGTFFEAPGRRRRPALIVFGGSEGGMVFTELQAALLASHGFDALALAYFDPTGALPGIPTTLQSIPLEYFGTAIDWLGHQRSVDRHRLGVVGASRGGELALLLGTRYPQLKAVVARAPSSVVWSGLPNFTKAAWTAHGQPVPFLIPKVGDGPTGFDWYLNALRDPNADPQATIPVERINGPVLLIDGADDQLWPSPEMATRVMDRLQTHGHPFADEQLSYANTGHLVPFPYEPTTTFVTGPGLGGTPKGAARASRDHWPKFLQFLDRSLGRHRHSVGHVHRGVADRGDTRHPCNLRR